ncbi:hypothetical protein [Mesorhizobium sp. B2-8-9]|nr:hypothetical protein [Mesorhizobium sp. B2-8-9]
MGSADFILMINLLVAGLLAGPFMSIAGRDCVRVRRAAAAPNATIFSGKD